MEQCDYKTGLNSNQLKLIAISTMVIDHCTAVFLPEENPIALFLRILGRVAAPVMCFFVAEGYYHTSNLKKYIGRLLIIAVVSHIPFNLCFQQDVWAFWLSTDVVFSLLFGLLSLVIYKSSRIKSWQKCTGIILCWLLSYSANWNYIGVLWILGFGIFHKSRKKQMIFYCLMAGIYLLQPFLYGMDISAARLGVFLAIPLFFLYNGERGKKSKLIQWGFYWFYPVHLLIIYIMEMTFIVTPR